MVVEDGAEYNFIYLLPPKEGEPQRVMVPSQLQMGWSESAAFFTTASQAAANLANQIIDNPDVMSSLGPHPLEHYALPPELDPAPSDTSAQAAPVGRLLTVFIDDFCQLLAIQGIPDAAITTATRSPLHSIHAIFPPPNITGHTNGKDPISKKKLEKGDARWQWEKDLLGFLFHGLHRTVKLPSAKAAKYLEGLQDLLKRSNIPLSAFRKLHGRLQHVSQIMPGLKGFMTPLNAQLKKEHSTIGLGDKSELREVLEYACLFIKDLQCRPTHVYELVPPTLPFVYGYGDASAEGAGGVWLPCTSLSLKPIVWRIRWPADIEREVRNHHGTITNSDVELAAVFIAFAILVRLIPMKHLSAYLGSDNKPTVAWNQRMASKSPSKIPDRFLRAIASIQRGAQTGPLDVEYEEGDINKMADFASRSWLQHKLENDTSFLTAFNSAFPLPISLGQWTLFQIPPDLILMTLSVLRNSKLDNNTLEQTFTGNGGLLSVSPTAATHGCRTHREISPSTARTVQSPSWPLLHPSGKEDSTIRFRLEARRSKEHFGRRLRPSSPISEKIPGKLSRGAPT